MMGLRLRLPGFVKTTPGKRSPKQDTRCMIQDGPSPWP